MVKLALTLLFNGYHSFTFIVGVEILMVHQGKKETSNVKAV